MTNADIIRAMSNEQLAKMFIQHDFHTYQHCPTDSYAENCQRLPGTKCDCQKCWVDWLAQEVRPIIVVSEYHGEKVVEYKYKLYAELGERKV